MLVSVLCLISSIAFESSTGTASGGRPNESISSSSVDDISTTIHRTRSQRIASLPLRYRHNANRSVSSSTHSTLSQPNSEMSPRIIDEVGVSAVNCVCNICQTFDIRKPGRFCSSCDYCFHLSCCRPRLTKTQSAGLPVWYCQFSSSNGDHPDSQLRWNQETCINTGPSIPGLASLRKSAKIPKDAGTSAVNSLGNTTDDALHGGDADWCRLFTFAPIALNSSTQSSI